MTAAATKVRRTKDAEQAQAAGRALSTLLKNSALRTMPADAKEHVTVTVPTEAFELFLDILAQLANGNAVALAPVHAELAAQQDTDLLSVSRPLLAGLLDGGKATFLTVGTYGRVLVADLVAYKEHDAAHHKRVADELSADAQKLGLGY
jgi:hypothetical protein